MLSLQLPVVDGEESTAAVLPLSEAAALAFERALLAVDARELQSELQAALASDRNAASWALRLAEIRTGKTVNQTDEAARYLSGCFAAELLAALVSHAPVEGGQPVAWRLPRLAASLHGREARAAEFEKRLEFEKLESLKELAYGAGHEINNPLANIAARAQTLLEDEADPERQRKLIAIHRQAMRAHEMIADLMLFARPPKLLVERSSIGEIARAVVQEYADLAQEYEVALQIKWDGAAIEMPVDATQLGVAIGALVKNGLESVGSGGHVSVAVGSIGELGQRFAEVRVRDDGSGISEEIRRHMFDPFFSGREAGRGLGFGLSKCWRIVTDHGGTVTAANCTDGAEFIISLPMGPA